ncbi:TspO/MBR family protein [Viridibacillus arvi]|uniref:TspO/MBR family protein n=1 Tax=Viridibacillus arvi TaxID=263475 RepID=UPI003D016490
MIFSAILVFILVYLLFSLSGILFPIDLTWYASLKKPSWTPTGKTIGFIWAVLYALIALSLAIVEYKVGLKNTSITFMLLWVINYLANQAFSFFEFIAKRLDLAFLDTAIVAITTFLLIFATLQYSILAAILLIPYLIWAFVATILAWFIYRLNSY